MHCDVSSKILSASSWNSGQLGDAIPFTWHILQSRGIGPEHAGNIVTSCSKSDCSLSRGARTACSFAESSGVTAECLLFLDANTPECNVSGGHAHLASQPPPHQTANMCLPPPCSIWSLALTSSQWHNWIVADVSDLPQLKSKLAANLRNPDTMCKHKCYSWLAAGVTIFGACRLRGLGLVVLVTWWFGASESGLQVPGKTGLGEKLLHGQVNGWQVSSRSSHCPRTHATPCTSAPPDSSIAQRSNISVDKWESRRLSARCDLIGFLSQAFGKLSSH